MAWRDVFRLLIMAGIPIALVLLQPDLGTAIIMVIVLLVLLAVAGLPIRILVMLLIGTAFVALVAVEAGLLHSFQIAADHLLEPGRQELQPVREIRHLQPAGGEGRHRLGWIFRLGDRAWGADEPGLRARTADRLIFTAVGEQLGFVGAVGVLSLLGVIVWRVLHAAVVAGTRSGA